MNSAFLREKEREECRQTTVGRNGGLRKHVHHSSHFMIVPAPLSKERVDLVDKDDGRLEFACEREERCDEFVRLAEPVEAKAT
jgi:hypothetical protein